MNNSVTPQFTEGPVNADFSGVLQVDVNNVIFFPLSIICCLICYDYYNLDTSVPEETAMTIHFNVITSQVVSLCVYYTQFSSLFTVE